MKKRLLSLLLVLCITLALLPGTVLAFPLEKSALIPDNAVTFNGHYYKIYSESVSWLEAKQKCESLGGHLVTITSQGEQHFIETLNSDNQRLWIGAFRDDDSHWEWVTNEKWSYTNWGAGEPNDSSNVVSNENCVAIWPITWNDLNSNNKSEQSGFICEWDFVNRSISIAEVNTKIEAGATLTLTATYTTLGNVDAEIGAIRWSSSDNSILRFVESSGETTGATTATLTAVFEGVSKGSVTVTCSGNDASDTCEVGVDDNSKISISLSVKNTDLYLGKTDEIVNNVIIKSTDQETFGTATWSSSNPSVFQLTELASNAYQGTFSLFQIKGSAVSKGTSTITITTTDGAATSFTVQVKAVPTTISMAGNSEIMMGESDTLYTTITFGTDIDVNDTITWTTSDSSVIAFSESGQSSCQESIAGKPLTAPYKQALPLYGLSSGEATITCKLASGVSHFFKVSVYNEEYKKLQALALEWETAYQAYTDALVSETEKLGSVSESTVEDQAKALQKADEEAGGHRLVSFGPGESEEVIQNVYQAVSKFLAEQSCTNLDMSSIDVSGADKDAYVKTLSQKIIQKIFSSMDSKPYHYKINGAEISITGFNMTKGVFSRQISYKPAGGQARKIASLTSTQSQIASVLEKFINELMLMEGALVREAYAQMLKAGLGKSVNNLVKSKLTSCLSKYDDALAKNGLGRVLTAMENCIGYFNHVKKFYSLSNDDPAKLALDLSAMKEYSFDSKIIQNDLVKTAMKAIENSEKRLNKALADYIAGRKITTFGGESESVIDKAFSALFQCPVSITVYDSKGNQVGYVGDDGIEYDENVIYIEHNGDKKIIYSGGEPLQFQIEGTDSGVLNCTFEEYTDAAAAGRVNFYNLDLCEGKKISAEVPSSSLNSQTVILSEENSPVPAHAYITASDYESETISVTCALDAAEGGQVYGTGSYVRGDAVTLHAIPEDGYVFLGWQNSDGALESGSTIYEFNAREDVILTALFAEDESDPNTVTATILKTDSESTTVKVESYNDVFGEDTKVIASCYEDGKMVDVISGTFDLSSMTIQFEKGLNSGWILFFLDSNYTPLCAKTTLQ